MNAPQSLLSNPPPMQQGQLSTLLQDAADRVRHDLAAPDAGARERAANALAASIIASIAGSSPSPTIDQLALPL